MLIAMCSLTSQSFPAANIHTFSHIIATFMPKSALSAYFSPIGFPLQATELNLLECFGCYPLLLIIPLFTILRPAEVHRLIMILDKL